MMYVLPQWLSMEVMLADPLWPTPWVGHLSSAAPGSWTCLGWILVLACCIFCCPVWWIATRRAKEELEGAWLETVELEDLATVTKSFNTRLALADGVKAKGADPTSPVRRTTSTRGKGSPELMRYMASGAREL